MDEPANALGGGCDARTTFGPDPACAWSTDASAVTDPIFRHIRIAWRRARGSRGQNPADVPRSASHLTLVLLSNPHDRLPNSSVRALSRFLPSDARAH